MINRIRDIRKAKNLTLADVAARCTPPTTAQSIGRLETGMRQLSLEQRLQGARRVADAVAGLSVDVRRALVEVERVGVPNLGVAIGTDLANGLVGLLGVNVDAGKARVDVFTQQGHL